MNPGFTGFIKMIYALGFFLSVLPSYLIRFKLSGLPLTLLEVLLLILLVVWFAKGPSLRLSPAWIWPLSLFLISALGAAVYSPQPLAALGRLKTYFFEPVLFFLLFIDQVKTRRDLEIVLRFLAVGLGAVSLFAIIQRLTGFWIPEPWQALSDRRVTSVFPYPNALALFLGPLLVLFTVRSFEKPRFLLNLVLILAFFTLLFSGSLGGLVAVVLGIGFLIFFHPSGHKWLPWFLAAVFISVSLFFSQEQAHKKFIKIVTLKENSSQVRLALWQGTFNLLTNRPFLGSGLAGFPDYYDQYRLPRHTELLLYPHNLFLNFWTELGLLGLVAFCWLLIKIWQLKIPAYHFAAFFTLLMHGMVDVPYFKNDLALVFWLVVGVLYLEARFIQAPDKAKV